MRLEMAGPQSAAGTEADRTKLAEYIFNSRLNTQAGARATSDREGTLTQARYSGPRRDFVSNRHRIAAISILTKKRLFWGVSRLHEPRRVA